MLKQTKEQAFSLAWIVLIILFALCIGGVIYIRTFLKPKTDLHSAAERATNLVTSVGGLKTVCQEASELFRVFPLTNQLFLREADPKMFPAIQTLGTGHKINPGYPPFLSIRVGNHIDGFHFIIVDTNSPNRLPIGNHMELVISQVYVTR